ncbi:MAG TPA: NUDIX hydrolase [Vicinamibacterales bacterium]|nr:NUDIX hydrolase [Vicinamibacterales bacterium]
MSAELLARTTVYKGRIFQVEVDAVKLPSGHTVDMEIVRHPGSVVLLPIPEPGAIILIRQYRYTIDRWIWELPAGSLKPDEDPDEAAARECEEEIGLAPARVTRLRGYYPTPGFCDEEMIYYRCEDLRPPAPDSTARKDDDEEIEPKTFTLDDADALVQSGEIVDLKTLAGLALLRSAR